MSSATEIVGFHKPIILSFFLTQPKRHCRGLSLPLGGVAFFLQQVTDKLNSLKKSRQLSNELLNLSCSAS